MTDDRPTDELLAGAAHDEQLAAERRDEVFSAWFVASVEIAARTHPERLVRALGRLFDVRAATLEAAQVRQEVRTMRFEAKALSEAVGRDLDDLERRMTGIEGRMEKAARAFGVLEEFYRERNKPAPNGQPKTGAKS